MLNTTRLSQATGRLRCRRAAKLFHSMMVFVCVCGFSSVANGEPLLNLDFDDGTFSDWSTQTAGTVGWLIGTYSQLSSSGFNIPTHNSYIAASNDDDANPDSSLDLLISPAVNLSGAISATLAFDAFYNGDYGSTAHVIIDYGGSDTVFNLSPSSIWQTISIDLADFLGDPTVQMAFWHNDNSFWASGFAIDNVTVTAVPIPEPASLSLLALGAVMVMRRSRRR